jgi:hypothetical protein
VNDSYGPDVSSFPHYPSVRTPINALLFLFLLVQVLYDFLFHFNHRLKCFSLSIL